MKVGFVSLVGNTNAGKSTLLNAILGSKLVITSSKPQTTRVNISGVYNDADSQIVFVDTPGFHVPHKKLGDEMIKEANRALKDESIDLTVLVIDGKEFLKHSEMKFASKIDHNKMVIVLNKIDLLFQKQVESIKETLANIFPNVKIIEMVAKDKFNVDDLIKTIKERLNEGERYYPLDMVSDHPLAFMASEIVREKVMRLTEEEVPHSVTTYTKEFVNDENLLTLTVYIIVERESQKPIIIGKGGSMIKKITQFAEKDIASLAGKEVQLETFVKVQEDWRDNDSLLKKFGLKE